jgi:hypothetical protein
MVRCNIEYNEVSEDILITFYSLNYDNLHDMFEDINSLLNGTNIEVENLINEKIPGQIDITRYQMLESDSESISYIIKCK